MIKQFITPALTLVLALQSSATTIVLDYDSTPSNTFFSGNAAAKAAVDKAAADVSAILTTALNPISSSDYSQTGSGPSGANADASATLSYTNPNDGSFITNQTPSLGQDEFRIYVGARALGGTTLGQGGPGGTGRSIGGGSASNGDDYEVAFDDAISNLNGAIGRGNTTLFASSVTDSYTAFSRDYDYTLNYAPTIGNLWFDNDDVDWHYDHTTAVEAGKIDLYSVALHEILHTIGIGSYDSWDAQIVGGGTEWTGQEAIDVHGTGVGLIEGGGDESHIAENTMSARLSDGVMQEVVMDPNIVAGVRKELTELDVAFLRDLGWQTIPEPSSTLLLGLGSFALIMRRRR